jgi:uracil-DNA glycosylase
MASKIKPIVFVGESWSDSDLRSKQPFSGSSGIELFRMLNEAGVVRATSLDRELINKYYASQDPAITSTLWSLHSEIYLTNVFNLKPDRNDLESFCGGKADGIPGYPPLLKSKYVRAEFEPELDRLCREVLDRDPNLVVCLGNTALWALAGRTGIMKVRGTTLESTHTVAGFKLLPTYHPSAVNRQWELRPTVIADLMKAKRESTSDRVIRPEREIWIEPTLDDIIRFESEHIRGCKLLSVDIETSGSRITCIGFAPSPSVAIVIPFDDTRAKNGNYWQTKVYELECWKIVRRILLDPSTPKLFQNGAYDIAFLWRAYGIKTINAAEDTMLLQHALQPEALKGLGYLGSIYSDEGSWKHMRKKDDTIKRDA